MDIVFTFKFFNVTSNSYENINVFQGVDFAMNATKILEKTLAVCRCLYPRFVF